MGCASIKGKNQKESTGKPAQKLVHVRIENTMDLKKEAILGSWQVLNSQVANVGCIAFMRYTWCFFLVCFCLFFLSLVICFSFNIVCMPRYYPNDP